MTQSIDIIQSADPIVPNRDEVFRLESFFKSFGSATRLKILLAMQTQSCNVSTLSETIQLPLSALSHQLNLLLAEKLIKRRKEGKQVFYSLDDAHVLDILKVGYAHISEPQ